MDLYMRTCEVHHLIMINMILSTLPCATHVCWTLQSRCRTCCQVEETTKKNPSKKYEERRCRRVNDVNVNCITIGFDDVVFRIHKFTYCSIRSCYLFARLLQYLPIGYEVEAHALSREWNHTCTTHATTALRGQGAPLMRRSKLSITFVQNKFLRSVTVTVIGVRKIWIRWRFVTSNPWWHFRSSI